MFMWMRNPMKTLKSPYDSWLTQNSKWLPSKPAEIIFISQWAQYWQYSPHVSARKDTFLAGGGGVLICQFNS